MRAAERMAARAAGLKTYFTGKPCPRGHISGRFVSKGSCVACTAASKIRAMAENPDRVRALSRARRLRRLDHSRELDSRHRVENREAIREQNRAWKRRNPNYERDRKASDIQTLLRSVLRNRFRAAFSGNVKSGSAVRDLGCSIANLREHLESRFEPGMSWGNYGDWHIDHIRPLASFDLTVRKNVLIACNWRNLQPLWAIENLKKGARE